MAPLRIGTAGWPLPERFKAEFPGREHALARYARRFNAVEINTTFYRLHRPETFLAWAALVPADFRFSVKMHRGITHHRRLGPDADLDAFLEGPRLLGPRLGPILVQLPPSLAFDEWTVEAFLSRLRARHPGDLVLEPRHPSWFAPAPDALLRRHRVARVAADPAVAPGAGRPGGWEGLAYYRLHGSPRMYVSGYGQGFLEALAVALASAGVPAWCVFDNTAEGEATGDAFCLANLAAVPAGRGHAGSGNG